MSIKDLAREVVRAFRSGDLWALADAIKALSDKVKED